MTEGGRSFEKEGFEGGKGEGGVEMTGDDGRVEMTGLTLMCEHKKE